MVVLRYDSQIDSINQVTLNTLCMRMHTGGRKALSNFFGQFAHGLANTLIVFFLSGALGTTLGLFIAIVQTSTTGLGSVAARF